MKRLLSLTAAALFFTACGGAAAVMTPVGASQAAVSPNVSMVPVGVAQPSMEIIDMPELVVTAPGVDQEIQQRFAPQYEARFFYALPLSLDEAPQLPAPPCPACLR